MRTPTMKREAKILPLRIDSLKVPREAPPVFLDTDY